MILQNESQENDPEDHKNCIETGDMMDTAHSGEEIDPEETTHSGDETNPEETAHSGDENDPEAKEIHIDDSSLENTESHKRLDPTAGFSPQFLTFKNEFDAQTDNESKLQCAIQFMETSLGSAGTPHFRSFWEARRLCLSLFKENISNAVRNQLWNKYSDLSKEARRLKDILDEQSAFAVEQIEIAIHALENELEVSSEQIDTAALEELLVFPHYLKENYNLYLNLQRHLTILNTQATRINALRKELLKTEMRVRHKNKFFHRLSTAGDKVFPIRKELIKQISLQFTQDVNNFISEYFGSQEFKESLFVLREEIKSFQGLAKVLTLNTHSFTQTRTRLSDCWDKIKVEEKERKKERLQKKVEFKQNAEEINKHIQILKEAFEKGEESISNAQKKLEAIVTEMRETELGRDELKVLRDEMNEIRKLIQSKTKADEDARQHHENEKIRLKKEKFLSFKSQIEKLLQENDSKEADELISDRDALISQIQDSLISKSEKQELDRLLKPLKDMITEKKEQAMLALSEDDRQALQQLQAFLKQRKEGRQEIKNQLEVLRKSAGSSSLDFEKAMNFTNQINEEKERLEKANQAITEIERKIAEVQSKI